MKTAIGLKLAFLVSFCFLMNGSAHAADRPNVLIIMADDCTFSDLPVYGGQNAKTPNIDALVRQGLTFDRAYLCEAMCQPCRAALFSGQFPLRNGCAWNHSASVPTLKSLPHCLVNQRYRVGICGKVHVQPRKAFPFEKIGGFTPSCVKNPTPPHDIAPLREFFTRDRSWPFCAVVALVEPHVPWVMGDASKYPTDKIKLPPNIADTPRTRIDYGRYLAEITYMDSQVGEILRTLDATGMADNTLVLFTSEQGSQFPGCKWTNWDTGLHTGLIARWPGMVPAGKRTNAIVQYVDVLPTLIDVSGGDPPTAFRLDGASFKSVLMGATNTHRKYAYGIHNNIPEGPPFPIRSVTDGTHRYIRNLLPDEIYIEKHLMGMTGGGGLNNPYWSTWVAEAWANKHTYGLVKRYTNRPAEHFYHTAKDPYEMKNLADEPSVQAKKKSLSEELDRWMKSQGDPGAKMDTIRVHRAAKKREHIYKAPSK